MDTPCTQASTYVQSLLGLGLGCLGALDVVLRMGMGMAT